MTSLSLTIRPARLRDLPGLMSISSVLTLNQPETSLAPYQPAQAALSSILPRRNRSRFFVADSDEGLLAFAHFQPEAPDQRWQLIALGASTGVYDVTPLWEELLERSVVAAGLKGVKRLFARPPVDSPASRALRAIGYTSYANDFVLAVENPRLSPSRLLLRRQEAADTWAINQLYNTVVPRQVQYAEAFTSHRWDSATKTSFPSGVTTAAWLVEEAFQIVAYARVKSFGTVHVLDIIVHPDWIGITGDVIDGALGKVAAERRLGRVYSSVRGYQMETLPTYEERGFQQVVELELSVKYTTARALAPVVEALPQPEGVLERLPKPKRAPSFFIRPSEDRPQGLE
jgi:hypothetical protein